MKKRYFADSWYFIALVHPRDEHHDRVKEFNENLESEATEIITTEEVLVEFLAGVGDKGSKTRNYAVKFTRAMLDDKTNVQVMHQSHSSFLRGLQLYQDRPDKEYSLVDCISMNAMKDKDLREVLTGDRHFKQEPFIIMFPKRKS